MTELGVNSDMQDQNNQEKKCPKCGILKLPTLFQKNKLKKDGLDIYCKPCKSIIGKDRRRRRPPSERRLQILRRKAGQSRCVDCGKEADLSEFRANEKSETRSRCNECFRPRQRLYMKTYRPKETKRTPSQRRRSRLIFLYKLTLEQFQAMKVQQGGVCAICGSPPKANRDLSVDHDHSCCEGWRTCGKCIRGLLCTFCNSKLGWFEKYEEEIVNYLSTPEDHT